MRNAVKRCLQTGVLGGLLLLNFAPVARAWVPVDNMHVSDGNMSVSVSEAYVDANMNVNQVQGTTYITNANGHGAYIQASFWDRSDNGGSVQTNRNYESTAQWAHGTGYFWLYGQAMAQAKTCVDVPFWLDPCSSKTGVVYF